MKLVVFICLVASALAAPPSRDNYNDNNVQILSYENVKINFRNYKYGPSQSDRTKQEKQNELITEDNLGLKGSFSWVAPNGRVYHVNYVADDNGHRSELDEGVGHDPILVGSLLG